MISSCCSPGGVGVGVGDDGGGCNEKYRAQPDSLGGGGGGILAVAGSNSRGLASGGNALGGAASGAMLGANRLLLNMVLLVSPAEDHRLIVPAGLQHKISKHNLGS